MGTFTMEEVGGFIFRFDLKIQNLLGSEETCAKTLETCHMAVYKFGVWRDHQERDHQGRDHQDFMMVGRQDINGCTRRKPVKSKQ